MHEMVPVKAERKTRLVRRINLTADRNLSRGNASMTADPESLRQALCFHFLSLPRFLLSFSRLSHFFLHNTVLSPSRTLVLFPLKDSSSLFLNKHAVLHRDQVLLILKVKKKKG